MTVAATQERMEKTLAFLKRRASQGMPCPTNREIAKELGFGKQKFQPWDRTQGIKWPKCEHGAIMVAALVYCGLIQSEIIGRNMRRITILATGQVLEPQRPRMAA